MPTPHDLITAYRHLLRHSLHAVQYSKPARYVVRDRLRANFRSSTPDDFDAAKVQRTLEFLDGAAKTRGIEHKVLQNLCYVWWERGKLGKGNEVKPLRDMAYEEFDRAVERLNESLGLCLR
ncbi:DUF1763-domain-containing protein [Teratosphaeria nubilosa]|uniref:DUF1763-domain-containing protein n=1 Tax=Teratosphaeria nubilosa TaxID=161662 RepID=A0A6G1L5T4_9PEZI|nr:DUF1763-domain-containing protein [Teratosphaeria nubilosa]